MSFSFNWQCPLEPLKVEQFSGTDCVLLVLPLETLAFINTNNGENNEERDEIFMRFFLTSPVLQRWCPEMSTASSVSGSSFFSAHCSEFLTWNYGVCCTKDELSTERILFFLTIVPVFLFSFSQTKYFLIMLELRDGWTCSYFLLQTLQFIQFVLHWNSICFPLNLCYFFMTQWRFQAVF